MIRVALIFFLFLLLLGAAPAHATIAYVQSKQAANESNTSLSATFDSNNTVGCMIFVAAATLNMNLAAPLLNTPTDSEGDMFLPLNPYYEHNNAYYVRSWYALNCNGGANTVTVTGTEGYGTNMIAVEYSGTDITLDQQGVWPCGSTSNTGVSGVISPPSIFTSNSAELVIGWAYDPRVADTLAVNNSYTLRAQGGVSANQYVGTLALADFSASAVGDYSTTFSGATGSNLYAGAASFSEGGIVTVPAIEQLACGDALEPWHEMGTFFAEDVLLGASKSGDYIFVGYRNDGSNGTPTIADTNGYDWTVLQTSATYVLWYAVIPMDEPAGDIITFSNVDRDNTSRVIELHGLSGLPNSNITSGDSPTMSLSLSGYTTPSYCTTELSMCSAASQWYGAIFNIRTLLRDFFITAESVGPWAINTIPGTSSPGTIGIDLFPTDFNYVEMWLPGAPAYNVRHKATVY